MRVVGLTGGIASGKSTVSAMLRDLGAQIVDADVVARDIVKPGEGALAQLTERFGTDILASDGTLDRKKLGAIIFSDAAARSDLNAITHPAIAAESQRRIATVGEAGHDMAFYEAALIVENGLHKAMHALIVVAVTEATQLARLTGRDSLSREQALERIASQLPLAEKVAVADYVVDNNGSIEETRTQVEALWKSLARPETEEGRL